MIVVGYWIDPRGDIILDSRGGSCYVSDLCQILDYLLEPHDAEGQATYLVTFNIDALAIPILQLLPLSAVQQLAERKSCEFTLQDSQGNARPFRIFYPRQDEIGQALIITDKRGKWGEHRETTLWNLANLLPEGIEPPSSPEETEDYARKILTVFTKLLGFQPQPDHLYSPINVIKPYLQRMSLPKWTDLPPKAANFSAKCQSMPWVEAHILGSFERVWDVDQSNAYASVLAKLPDWRLGDWKQGGYQKDAVLGYINCDYEIYDNVTLHPIIDESEGGGCASVGLHRDRYLTKAQAEFIRRWKIGRVDLKEGVWWFPTKSTRYPLWTVIERLKQQRAEMSKETREVDRAIGRLLAKRCMTGLWGYAAKWDWQNGSDPDEFFNPPWSADISTMVSLRNADFIYRHKLVNNTIVVVVDGFMCDCDPHVTSEDEGWKLSGEGPALVVSGSDSWFADKRPEGKTLVEMQEIMRAKPQNSSWTWTFKRRATLGDCLLRGHNYALLGREITCQATLHLKQERNRIFPKTPRDGKSLLSGKTYRSKPIHLEEPENA